MLERLAAKCRIDRADASAFVGGARIRIRRGIDQDAAVRAIAELQALGAVVEVEPNRPPTDALAGLDEIDARRDETPALAPEAANLSLDALRESLRALHGDAPESTLDKTVDRGAPTRAGHARASQAEPFAPSLSGLDAPALVDPDERQGGADDPPTSPLLPEAIARALQAKPSPPPPPFSSIPSLPTIPSPAEDLTADATEEPHEPDATTVEADPEARFRPPQLAAQELVLDRAAPAAAPPPPPTREELELRPRCPEHDVPLDDGLCPECAEEEKPVPEHLMQGALRKRPMARLAAGATLGLLAGYLLSAPYAERAERRVAELRALANADRYRPIEEAKQNARRLDGEAESASTRAFAGTIAIWLVVAGASIAGWYRVT
ncbi:MAG TPA: hypothetical protein VFF06_10560 [Polyangia bacterium]|nr:hypothetical protein [Polyangia bacterium]